MGLTFHPHISAEVLERVELYIYSPSGPSWSIKRAKHSYQTEVMLPGHLPYVNILAGGYELTTYLPRQEIHIYLIC